MSSSQKEQLSGSLVDDPKYFPCLERSLKSCSTFWIFILPQLSALLSVKLFSVHHFFPGNVVCKIVEQATTGASLPVLHACISFSSLIQCQFCCGFKKEFNKFSISKEKWRRKQWAVRVKSQQSKLVNLKKNGEIRDSNSS